MKSKAQFRARLSKRQTSDSSWEFLKIENVQLKTVQKSCYRQK